MSELQIDLRQVPSASNRHFYSCFGLRIASDIAFAELDPAPGGTADLHIRLGSVIDPAELEGATEARQSDEAVRPSKRMDFGMVGRYEIHDDTITISPLPGVRHPDLSLPLLGPVLATFLHQRGLLVLHGNGVLLKGGLTAFVGDSGAGKSTLGGWLSSTEGTLFTDDILAVGIAQDGTPIVQPGYSLVKLSSPAMEAFAHPDARILPVGVPGYPKVRICLPRSALPQPCTIRRICVLRRGPDAEYERLNDMARFRAVVENTYMAKYPDAFVSAERKATHLQQCGAVARRVEVGILTVPTGIERLHEVLPLLEAEE